MEYYQRCRQAAQYLDANIPVSGFRHIVLSAKLDAVSYVSPVCPWVFGDFSYSQPKEIFDGYQARRLIYWLRFLEPAMSERRHFPNEREKRAVFPARPEKPALHH
jgi:hypothetical protein